MPERPEQGSVEKLAQKKKQGERGFSLVELMITIAAGTIVILGVYRLLGQTLWSYNLQEQMTDMYQNATYTVKKLTEELSQVGAALPDSGYQVVYAATAFTNDVTIRANPRCAKQKDTATITTSAKIPVDSGNAFKAMDSVVVDTGMGNAITKAIDSVKISSTPDTVYLKSPATVTLKSGDMVYAAKTQRYFISNRNFCFNDAATVLAENIDSLAMTFYDVNHVATTVWKDMSTVSVYVRVRTSAPDRFYKHPTFNDGYRRLALSMDIRLRNRF